MDTQLFVLGFDDEPCEKKMQPIGNRRFASKPTGGIWTSTYLDNETGSDWVTWCQVEEYKLPTGLLWHSWLLTPDVDARVYHVDCESDLLALVEKYPLACTLESNCWITLDFEAMAEHYEALHLTQMGQIETRFTNLSHPNLYGWDVESTLWFNWTFQDVRYMGHRRFGRAPSERTHHK